MMLKEVQTGSHSNYKTVKSARIKVTESEVFTRMRSKVTLLSVVVGWRKIASLAKS